MKRIGKMAVVLACGWAFAATAGTLSQGPARPDDQALAAIQGVVVDAVEYYHPVLDHYFVTALPIEIAQLDAGKFPGWQRTNQTFKVFDPAATVVGAMPVCRFYGSPNAGLDSHFYSASPDECADISVRFGSSWLAESGNAFGVWLPDPQTGQCPALSDPVYRSWNNRSDSNHRFTTDPVIHRSMITRGYVAEGYGPPPMAVAMCAPRTTAMAVKAPACVVFASNNAPVVGTSMTLTAYCDNAPTTYSWTGCSGTAVACSATSAASGQATYTVVASNAAGSSAPATFEAMSGV